MRNIKTFAAERVSGSKNLYNSRGKSKDGKLYDDIVVGAMGEYAVYYALKEEGFKCSKPDLKIYKGKKKSFSADLQCNDLNIHVKSQSVESEKKYGFSWLLQRSDPMVKNPTIYDVFAFCYADLDKKVVTFLGFCDVNSVDKHDLWAECKVPMFRRTKIALYLSHLADYDIVYSKIAKKFNSLLKVKSILKEVSNENL